MVDRATFDRIKYRYGRYASWAVWADTSDRPKSNVGDLRVLDPDANPDLLRTLRNDVVMVGLNVSRSLLEPFCNFHDPSSKANDFKLRYAFIDTPYWGAYMTDIIKDVEMVESSALRNYLRADPSVVSRNVAVFLAELDDLQCVRPTILAFGAAAHRLVSTNVSPARYSRVVELTHYSHRMSKDVYRQAVLGQLARLDGLVSSSEPSADSPDAERTPKG